MDFTNKVVVVTGASSGIGEETAYTFAKYSANLVLVGRNEENLAKVGEKVENESGLKPLLIQADVTNDEDVDKIVNTTLQHYGKIDVLVNNAGAAIQESILNPSLKVFDDTFQLNVRAAYHLMTKFAPELIESKGNVVNVSSIASLTSSHFALSYSLAKAAMDHLTRLAAVELGPKGVRVNTVNPGVTETKFQVRMLSDQEAATNFLSARANNIPLRKLCTTSDIANAIVHLASDLSQVVTGTNLVVDGGLSLL